MSFRLNNSQAKFELSSGAVKAEMQQLSVHTAEGRINRQKITKRLVFHFRGPLQSCVKQRYVCPYDIYKTLLDIFVGNAPTSCMVFSTSSTQCNPQLQSLP